MEMDDKQARPPFRPTLVVVALIMGGIVWATYHYTGVLFTEALELLRVPSTPEEVQHGVVNLLGAVTGSAVAGMAITGMTGVLNKLAER